MKYLLKNIQDTFSFAKKLEQKLKPGMVIALNGDLGAGKTTLTKALVQQSGSNCVVTSPTFVIMNIYTGRKKFYHFDLYRLNSVQDLEGIGAEEFFPAKDGITLIEWAEKMPELLPQDYLEIRITILDDTSREIELLSHGKLKIGEIKWPS